jgi:nucleoid-associated protein YgaU
MAELPMLRNGSKSEAVKGLKNALMTRAGDFHLFDRPLSDDFGPKTEQAVRHFQRGAGLQADGVVGPMTWEALGVLLVEPGDTLSGIAQERLGNADLWPDIFHLNEELLDDPDRIFPGQVLVLPLGC